MFDATFLLSGYHCIYRNGCQSITDDPDPADPDRLDTLGCCVHGAHFVDEEDLISVAASSALLDSSTWQFKARADAKGGPFKQKKSGEWVTRKTKGACIFLNRSDFPGGQGCALHRAALERGERPIDWKPDVCWQVPVRLDVHSDEYGNETVFVRAWERKDWGPGGEDFHWWCIEEEAAYTNPAPFFQTGRDELVGLIGEDLYTRLVPLLEELQFEAAVAGREIPVELGVKPGQ